VTVTVTQLAPHCGVTRTFRLHGHTGVNTFRFNGRLGGRPLAPGTYRITARALRSGRRLFVTRVVVVSGGRPTRSQLASLWMRNACLPAAELGATLPGAVTSGIVVGGSEGQSTKTGVLGASTSEDNPDHVLPASVLGPGSSDHGFAPRSPTDVLRLILFVVLGMSLVLAIRFAIRDLGR